MVDSRSRKVVNALMDQLLVVRGIEKTEPALIKHDFGNLKDAMNAVPVRMIWLHEGGVILEKIRAPASDSDKLDSDGNPVVSVPSAGTRLSNYRVRIWADDVEQAEKILDQLVTASKKLPNPDMIVFEGRPYQFPTENEGKWKTVGALIDAHIGIRSSVPARPVGETVFVTVLNQGQEFRAGIETPVGEPMNESEYDVDRLTTPWAG